jgi:hypothetical protein
MAKTIGGVAPEHYNQNVAPLFRIVVLIVVNGTASGRASTERGMTTEGDASESRPHPRLSVSLNCQLVIAISDVSFEINRLLFKNIRVFSSPWGPQI